MGSMSHKASPRPLWWAAKVFIYGLRLVTWKSDGREMSEPGVKREDAQPRQLGLFHDGKPSMSGTKQPIGNDIR
jgi:hypothetical protein